MCWTGRLGQFLDDHQEQLDKCSCYKRSSQVWIFRARFKMLDTDLYFPFSHSHSRIEEPTDIALLSHNIYHCNLRDFTTQPTGKKSNYYTLLVFDYETICLEFKAWRCYSGKQMSAAREKLNGGLREWQALTVRASKSYLYRPWGSSWLQRLSSDGRFGPT